MENLRALILESGGRMNLQTFTRALQRGKDGIFTKQNLSWVSTEYIFYTWLANSHWRYGYSIAVVPKPGSKWLPSEEIGLRGEEMVGRKEMGRNQ